jgi:hypothetical protein
MNRPGVAYLRWTEDEVETPAGPRSARVAWLVCDAPEEHGGTGLRYLAYLGERPAVTSSLIEELTALYPDVGFDWEALRRAVADAAGLTDVSALSDDEMALRLRALTGERGLSLNDLSLRLGYRQRNILPELLRYLDDPQTVARFERTDGSIFAYLLAHHQEYAFLLYKARLFFEDEGERLRRIVREEPAGFGGPAWRERREYWRAQLEAYARERAGLPGSQASPGPPGPDRGVAPDRPPDA